MTSEGAFGQEGLRQNDFVEKVMPDPSYPAPPMMGFDGLLGKSTRSDYWRLYFGIELDLYMEFQERDVLRIDSIPKEESGLGFATLQRVWMRPDTRVEVIYRNRSSLQAEMPAELLDILLVPRARRPHQFR
jgi:hypothetical protein